MKNGYDLSPTRRHTKCNTYYKYFIDNIYYNNYYYRLKCITFGNFCGKYKNIFLFLFTIFFFDLS